jgi:hypothetical protein
LNENVIMTQTVFCDAVDCFIRSSHGAYYSDDNHVSSIGAQLQFKLLSEVLE